MALSEHEQRVLDELERGLYAEDEQLARRLQKAAGQMPERRSQKVAARRIAGASVALAGLGVLLVGAIVHYSWMGVGGFILTLAGLLLATSTGKIPVEMTVAASAKNASAKSAGAKKAANGSDDKSKPWQALNEFFEERWNRRLNGD